METQTKMIYEFMKNNGSITSEDAFRYFDITRLSARIKDLRDMGVDIVTVREPNKNRPGTHARYHIKKEQPTSDRS